MGRSIAWPWSARPKTMWPFGLAELAGPDLLEFDLPDLAVERFAVERVDPEDRVRLLVPLESPFRWTLSFAGLVATPALRPITGADQARFARRGVLT